MFYVLDATYLVVGCLQQFILLIQQVQAPEDLAAVPVPPRQTAPPTLSPSPPANTTNTSSTGVPTPLSSLPQSTPSQRPLRQEATWSSFIRSVLRFVWYDEHNRICEPVALSSPRFTAYRRNGMCRVLHIHCTCPRCTRYSCTRTCGGTSCGPLLFHLGTTDRTCRTPWEALCAGKKVYRRDYRRTNVTCTVYGTLRSTRRYLKLTRFTPHLVDVLGCPKNVMDVEPRRMSRANSTSC